MLQTVISYITSIGLLFAQIFGLIFPTNPYQIFSDRFKLAIVQEPTVFDCGDCYAVVWATNYRSTGSVTYTYNGETLTAHDIDGGVLRADDTIHSVEVPKEKFDGCTYTVHSEFVFLNLAYVAVKGSTVIGTPTTFRGYDGDGDVKMLVLTDVHGLLAKTRAAVSHLGEKPDIVAMTGDISSEMMTKNDFVETVLGVSRFASNGEIPVIYVRGNHETRGEFATGMREYFPTPTGEFYFTTYFGPVSAVIVDSGEDKDDGHAEYSGLVDFATYRQNEFKWLNSLKPDTSADTQYRISLCHAPYIRNHFDMNWEAPVAALGTQLQISGHYHELKLEERSPYDIFIAGGKHDDSFIASLVTFKDGKAFFKACNDSGELLLDTSITL